MEKFVVDTNILLHRVDILEEDNIVIPLVVLQELDKLKTSKEVGFEARRAIRAIENSKVHIDLNHSAEETNCDDIILNCAKDHNAELYTKDICLRVKAGAVNITASDPYGDSDGIYTGVKEVCLSDSEMAKLYQNPEDNCFNLHVNQYLIVKNNCGYSVDKLRWDGTRLVQLKLPPSKILKPLNDLQACAIDLLNNKDIPIKIIAGTYGSGKTLLTARMGLYHVLQKGNYSKIFLIRNPIGSGEEIGFIKGDKDQKIEPFLKPIEQNLEGGEIQLQQMIQYRQLEYTIPWYIKGMSIAHSFIMVDEAEDMDKRLIKLIGTRIAEGSCICFSGDWRQSESKFMRDNGLIHLLNNTKDEPLVGAIVLDSDVRSDASKVFAELD